MTTAIATLALAGTALVGTALTAQAAPAGAVCASASPDLSPYDAQAPGSKTLPAEWAASGAVDYGFTSGGLRVSNATAGNIYVRAARVATSADETTPGCDGITASFTVAAVAGEYQEGLTSSVALGGASRYGGVLGFRHTGGQLQVYTVWVPADASDTSDASWRSAVVATLDPAVPHTVEMTAYLVPGPANDVMQVTIDGAIVAQGVFTWEPYAGLDPTQGQPHVVDTLLFRPWTSAPTADGVGFETAPARPDLLGKGFLFGDIQYSSFDGTAPAPTSLTPCAAPSTTLVDAPSGLLDTDLAASPTRSLGGHEFTDTGLHVWTTGTTDAPSVPTSESRSAGYLDVDVPLAQAAPVTADVTVNGGSAPGLNLILSDGRILVSDATSGPDSWWSGTPTPGLPSGADPTYQRAFGTLAEWSGALPSAIVDRVGYSLGSDAIGDATFRSLTLGCTTYSFVPEPVATPTPPPPDEAHAAMLGTTSDALLAALRDLGVTPQTPAQLGVTVSDANGAVVGPLNAATQVDVVVPWTSSDTWVDVYLYSTRSYVGTFPLVDGAVRLTGLDLSALAAGTHYLVLVGQETGSVTAVLLEIAADPSGSLADTGDGTLPATGAASGGLALVAVLLLAAGGTLLVVRRRAAIGPREQPRR